MTTYNGEKYLRDQLDSILNQTYKDFELIICDDNSSDGTKKLLAEYEKKDERIKVFFNEENLGFIKNFGKAISFCKGEYIAFSDQDDIWEAFKLEYAIKNIGTNDLYCSNSLIVDENNNAGNEKKTLVHDVLGLAYIPASNDILSKHLLYENFCQGATILAKAEFIKGLNEIPSEFKFHDQWYALVASVKNGIVYDDNCTLRYRQHGNNVTSNTAKNFMERFFSINKDNISKIGLNSYRCKFVSDCTFFPEDFREYAKTVYEYLTALKEGVIFKSQKLFIQNYKYWIFDKNLIHKILMILRHFLKVVMIKIFLQQERREEA